MNGELERPLLVRLLHMGDSITYGQHIDPNLRWTSIIKNFLEQKYLDSHVNILSINRGVSGETTRMGLERYPSDVQNYYPDVLTIQFGLNDCNCWLTDGGASRVSPLAFKANLIEMIERAWLFGVKYIILSNNHPTCRWKIMMNGKRYEDENIRYCEIVHEVAMHTAVTFCDIRKGFEEYNEKLIDHLLMPYPDQLHLNVEGNKLYANIIWPLIDEAIQLVIFNKDKEGINEKEKPY